MTYKSHGTGQVCRTQFAAISTDCVIEASALVFHPENIRLGAGVYIGHQSLINGYHRGQLDIGAYCWVGPQCFLHAAGGLVLEAKVGLGPGVRILTSQHFQPATAQAVLDAPLRLAPVHIAWGADLGTNSTVLPGVRIGRCAIIGAGSVVTRDIPDNAVAAGVPARVLRRRHLPASQK